MGTQKLKECHGWVSAKKYPNVNMHPLTERSDPFIQSVYPPITSPIGLSLNIVPGNVGRGDLVIKWVVPRLSIMIFLTQYMINFNQMD